MKFIDMTGQKINHLTFLRFLGNRYWECQCDCGNIVKIRKDQVTRSQYPKKDCGCGLPARLGSKLKDETGNRYGKLVVLYRTDDLRPGEARWHCKCDCGNECDVSGLHLRNGSVQSCGCLKYESHNGIDETGKRYGKLLVLYRTDKNIKSDGTHIFWHCKCDCGNECDVNGSYLRQGISTNCGCERSVGELKIKKILDENKILYQREYSFPDLLGAGGGKLRFDFGILDQNNNLLYLIEYDGIQHFKLNCFGTEQEDFNILKQHDKLKDDYCKEHNIPLIRIPYTKFKTLTIKDLLLNKGGDD